LNKGERRKGLRLKRGEELAVPMRPKRGGCGRKEKSLKSGVKGLPAV